jgi:hypothetical protein
MVVRVENHIEKYLRDAIVILKTELVEMKMNTSYSQCLFER